MHCLADKLHTKRTTDQTCGEDFMPDHLKNASNQLWRDEKEQVDYGALSIFRGDDNERFPDNPALLMSMNNLALTLLDSGQWEEAEVLQAQVCVLNQDLLGEEHPDTLTSQANLASMLSRQGRWAEAEALSLKVLDSRQRILGPCHSATLTSIGNLAYIYCWQSKWADAEALELQRFESLQTILGADNPRTLASLDYLAFIRSKHDRRNERGQSAEFFDMEKA